MRKAYSIPALLLAGLFACNDSGSKVEEASALKSTTADTMHTHAADAATAVTELPAIPEGAKVFFANLKDGQTVKSPFKVEMGAEGIALDTAGTVRQASGHHHILVNAGDSMTAGTVVPMDSTHLHFGKAQNATELKLVPGKYRLTLQYADGLHRSYGGRLASSVSVTVK